MSLTVSSGDASKKCGFTHGNVFTNWNYKSAQEVIRLCSRFKIWVMTKPFECRWISWWRDRKVAIKDHKVTRV